MYNSLKVATIFQPLVRFWSELTVEPLVLFYIIPTVLASLTDQNMYLEKACRVNQNYSVELCNELMLRNTTGIEVEDENTETVVTGIRKSSVPLNSLLVGCLILFWGAWSDRCGRRKPCIVIPLAAQLIVILVNLVTSSIIDRTPLEVPMYIVAVVDGISGGGSTLLVGIYSYISDVSPEDKLLYRIGLINMTLQLGNALGTFISGLLIRYLGYLGVYILCASMLFLAILYAIFYIKESPLAQGEQQLITARKSILAQFFDFNLVTQTFQVIAKNGPERRRVRIVLLLVLWVILSGPVSAENSLTYIFTRLQFNWTELEISWFSTYNIVTTFVGTTILVEILSNRLKIVDSLIAIIGLGSKVVANAFYASASVWWFFCVGSIFEMFSSGMGISVRSLASKVVLSDEIGKLNALLGLVESFVPTMYTPIYLKFWESTRGVFNAAFLLLSIGLMLPALPIFLWMYRIIRSNGPDQKEQQGEPVDVVGGTEMRPATTQTSLNNPVESYTKRAVEL